MSIAPSRTFLWFMTASLLAAALLTTGTAHAQDAGTIRGIVRLEGTGRQLDMAQISVVGTQLGARTREDASTPSAPGRPSPGRGVL